METYNVIETNYRGHRQIVATGLDLEAANAEAWRRNSNEQYKDRELSQFSVEVAV